MKGLTLHIEGMHCGHCLNAVARALASLPGVDTRSVRIGRAEVGYDEGVMDAERIAAAVADAGYPATPVPGPGQQP